MADSFSLLVNNSSPLLSYYPFADTLSTPNLSQGWNPCFTTSACPTVPGEQGNGSSFHVTSSDGAAFSIQWWGTWALNVYAVRSPSSDRMQETESSYPASPPAPSLMTFSSTTRKTRPSHLRPRGPSYWQRTMTFRPVTTPCRSSSITQPTRHRL